MKLLTSSLMKKHPRLRLLAACFGLLLLSLTSARAQLVYLTTNVFDDFDTGGNTTLFSGSGNGSVGGWNLWYGQGGVGDDDGSGIPGNGFNNVPIQCDPSQNSPDPEDTNASGALLIDIPSWDTTNSGDGGTTGVWFGSFHDDYIYDTGGTAWAIDANLYSSISFDIMVSNTVIPSASGDFGTIGVGFIAQGTPRGGDTYGNPTIPGSAQGHWQHIVVPLPKGTVQNASTIVGWCFKYGESETPAYPTNGQHITFWLDNVRVNLSPPPPPPTLTGIMPAIDGLNLWEVGTDTNQDEDIESATQGGNGWQLATPGTPVTYALTISPKPVPPAGFHTKVIINTDALAAFRTDPDRAAISMAMMDIVSAGDGTGTGYFRYQINNTNAYQSTGNQDPSVFGPDTGTNGTLASVSGSYGGTWTLKFTSPATGSIIAPGGAASPSFTLNANAVLAFSETTNPQDTNSQELSLYLGSSPGGTAGLAHEVVITDFTMAGNASAFEDNFATDTGPAQGSDWVADVSESVGTTIVIPVSGDGPDVWVQVSLPAIGYDLLGSTSIPTDNWTLLTGTNAADINGPITDTTTSLALGTNEIIAVPLADVEGLSTGVPTNHLFFEMIKNNGGLNQ